MMFIAADLFAGFVWVCAAYFPIILTVLITLVAVRIGSGIWSARRAARQWEAMLSNTELQLSKGKLSGTYAGYSVTVPTYASNTRLETLSVELKQPLQSEFLIVRDARQYVAQRSSPAYLADAVLPYLEKIKRLRLQQIELSELTLTFRYALIPPHRLNEALEIARTIAEAVEKPPVYERVRVRRVEDSDHHADDFGDLVARQKLRK